MAESRSQIGFCRCMPGTPLWDRVVLALGGSVGYPLSSGHCLLALPLFHFFASRNNVKKLLLVVSAMTSTDTFLIVLTHSATCLT